MPTRRKSTDAKDSSANLGFEAKLWLAIDKVRNNMDAAEHKHDVLRLIFLNTFGTIHHLAPQGMAGFVIAKCSQSSNQSGECDIRRAIPDQLFYWTQIPVCRWFGGENEHGGKRRAVSDLEVALAA
jgi:hypothetical protein